MLYKEHGIPRAPRALDKLRPSKIFVLEFLCCEHGGYATAMG